jgi:hypothetical protein
MTAEHSRLEGARKQNIPWKKWGPYLSERQWGTVRGLQRVGATLSVANRPVPPETTGASPRADGSTHRRRRVDRSSPMGLLSKR